MSDHETTIRTAEEPQPTAKEHEPSAEKLEVDDFDPEDCSIVVHGKRGKQRTVYLTEGGCQHVRAWIRCRGNTPGPVFCPVSQKGEVTISRMRGESISYILRRRQEQAGTEPFSPHDLRRSFVTTLLDAGEEVFTVQKLGGAGAGRERRGKRDRLQP